MGYIRLKSIVRTGGDPRTFAGALAKNSMAWLPGCGSTISAYREADGRYRTGLDDKAVYINKLSADEQVIERKRVKALKERLEEETGLDLSPTSKFYANVFATQDGAEQTAKPVKISDKELLFDEDKPEDMITAAWVMVYPTVARSLEETKFNASAIAYISNPKAETEAAYTEKMKLNQAITTLNSFNAAQLRRMGRLMELPINEDSSQEEAYMMLDKMLNKGTIDFGAYKNKKSVSVFNDLASLTETTLSIKDLIKQSISLSIYRKEKSTGNMMQGTNKIADSEEDLIAQIAASADERVALEKKVKGKQKLSA